MVKKRKAACNKIKNYTSTVPYGRSIDHIELKLVRHGAQQITKQYTPTGDLEGVIFSLNGITFKLPARIEKVKDHLMKEYSRPHKGTEEKVREQAKITAWKLLSDWVDVQMSLIELEQAEMMEVFLPYTYNASKNQTLFEFYKLSDFKQLRYVE